jgi:hypothetical protein
MLPRFDAVMPPELTRLRRPVSAYLRENVSYTFANFNDQATFANLRAQVGIDRIMFSADYPFGSMAEGREFLDALPIGPQDREKIAHQSAEKLLRMLPAKASPPSARHRRHPHGIAAIRTVSPSSTQGRTGAHTRKGSNRCGGEARSACDVRLASRRRSAPAWPDSRRGAAGCGPRGA